MHRIVFIVIGLLSICYPNIPDAVGENGVVVSSNDYATQVGIDALKAGGNAVDAAVAVGFALSVVHPSAGNLGGGGFMVMRFSDGRVTTIDFREMAPSLSDKDMFLDENLEIVPDKSLKTALASGVPGSVAGLGYAHEKYGSMKWNRLVKPSIKLASKGYKLSYKDMFYLNNYRDFLSLDEESKKIFSQKDGQYELGDVFIQQDLANTLVRISNNGYREFYEGITADNIVRCMKRTNGIISKQDLMNYHVVEREPIEFTYKDYKIYSMPPPSSGGICLAQILNQLELIDVSQFGQHSSDHIHFMVEAERRAYADRAHYLGDPDFVDVPMSHLISKGYAEQRSSNIDPFLASESENITYGNINPESEETTHYSVVDKWGNAVSVTTTINRAYGNGIVVDDSGFLLNNEMDDFSSKPGEPNSFGLIGNTANAIEPGKRMLSSMTPTIVTDNEDQLFLVLGSPGGSTIITTVAQLIVNVIDYEMNISDAVEMGRFHHQWLPDLIQYEPSTISDDTGKELFKRGYSLHPRMSIGEANCIQYNKNLKLYFGAADSRRGASAIGY